MFRHSAATMRAAAARTHTYVGTQLPAVRRLLSVETPVEDNTKQLRELALAEALAREEEAVAREKALRELQARVRESVATLNAVPSDLVRDRLNKLQLQLDQMDQTKVQTLHTEMEQFLFEHMRLPLSELGVSTTSGKIQGSADAASQAIKTTTTSAYANEYPNLKPTPDYRPYSQQELFLRQLAHARRSGRLGSSVTDVYRPNADVQNPTSIEGVSVSTLMAAGCHLGHAKAMWRPSTQPFVAGEYEGIHLIDLNETLAGLKRAAKVVEGVANKGGIILYVGTTREWEQQRALEEAARRSKGYYVSHRWIPGTITNFTEVSKQIGGDQEVEVDFADEPTNRQFNPRDRLLIKPDLVVLLNPVENRNCINECIKLRIPTIALCDTNMEPSLLTYPIPCNDDSTRASSLIVGVLSKAAEKGVSQRYSAFAKYKSKGV